MNRIQELFKEKNGNICSIFVTAGFPNRESLLDIVPQLEQSGADLVEIGIPFSDPLADGPTIQKSSEIALANGMNLDLLLSQLRDLRSAVKIPLVLMGYFNPIHQYGLEKFLSECKDVGIDGLIIPDISFELYCSHYEMTFERFGVPMVFLASADSSEERLRAIDDKSKAFTYLLSSSSTTGRSSGFDHSQKLKFDRIKYFDLKKPILLGFGIHDPDTFSTACEYFAGGIIGSEFIRYLEEGREVGQFIPQKLRPLGEPHLDSRPS